MRRVAVTGVSGHIGQRLLHLLDHDSGVGRVVGIDARDPLLRPAKLEFHRVDLASADLKPLLEGVDTLVHLAFVVSPPHDHHLLHRVNVEGTRRLLDAAGAVGVRQVVYMSSAMVYGAWSDNPVPLTEEALVRPNPGFVYAVQKAEGERLVGEWRADHPACAATILRPAAAPVAARGTWLARLWRGGPRVVARGADPPTQYVHEDDLAAAVHLAVTGGLDGVFNVAPDGWVAGEEARALAGGVRVGLPDRLVRGLLRAGWATGMSDLSPAALPYLVHPWVVANDRLRAAGWAPAQSNEEALVASSELPKWRRSLQRHRQEALLGGAGLLAAGIATGVVLAVRARRRARSG